MEGPQRKPLASSANHLYGRRITSLKRGPVAFALVSGDALDVKAEGTFISYRGVNQLIGHGGLHGAGVEYRAGGSTPRAVFNEKILVDRDADLTKILQRVSFPDAAG